MALNVRGHGFSYYRTASSSLTAGSFSLNFTMDMVIRMPIVNRQVISCCEGSLLYEWSNFQYEDTPESRAYLKQVCFPRMSMVKRPVRNHQLKIQEKLQANEVSLLYICANN